MVMATVPMEDRKKVGLGENHNTLAEDIPLIA